MRRHTVAQRGGETGHRDQPYAAHAEQQYAAAVIPGISDGHVIEIVGGNMGQRGCGAAIAGQTIFVFRRYRRCVRLFSGATRAANGSDRSVAPRIATPIRTGTTGTSGGVDPAAVVPDGATRTEVGCAYLEAVCGLEMITSTRRFCWRPAAESLPAIGLLSPFPAVVSRAAPIP